MKIRQEQNIFRGWPSDGMWCTINKASTLAELRAALYVVACRCQELEHKVEYLTRRRRSRKPTTRLKKYAT